MEGLQNSESKNNNVHASLIRYEPIYTWYIYASQLRCYMQLNAVKILISVFV